MKIIIKLSILVCLIGLSQSCKTVDVRTDYALENQADGDFQKGKALLEEAYLKMGYDQLAKTSTYEVNSLFKWKFPWSTMPMNALPGGRGNEILFRFRPSSFDGQVTFLEGRKKGKTFGLQSWKDYRYNKQGELKMKKSKRYNWGLATFHYLIEAPMRLRSAEIIRYAGEKDYAGNQYDLVYATWGQDAPHKEHDQWLVYINKATGMIDLTQLTINDYFLPLPNGMKGATVQIERTKASNGAYLPSLITIQLGKPKDPKKNVYTFELNNYKFDSFEENKLAPLVGVPSIGDKKLKK